MLTPTIGAFPPTYVSKEVELVVIMRIEPKTNG
jgi:hypothetical protein